MVVRPTPLAERSRDREFLENALSSSVTKEFLGRAVDEKPKFVARGTL
jgi:hypothetical protein